jgi:GTP cyclohydrolase I
VINTKIINIFAELLAAVGEDINRDGLKDTPKRAAEAFQFLTQGYDMDLKTVVNGALYACDNQEMVVVQNIELFSICEHHLMPIVGKCHVGYIPNGKVLGLSKVARIVDMFGRRLQIQEHLTDQIAAAIMDITGALGTGVVIEAEHLCMMARGVEKQHALVKTSGMLGSFKKDFNIRNEFFNAIK